MTMENRDLRELVPWHPPLVTSFAGGPSPRELAAQAPRIGVQ
ncbi:hypothetical protein [Ensifer oleiphilus]|nr:hypothetical protein [Ensifer oleiphilus]